MGELGAGLGLPSIVAARLGVQMVATDGDEEVMRLLRQNVALNCRDASLVAEKLLWGTSGVLDALKLQRPPDLLLAADVVYMSGKANLTDKLMNTILELAGPETIVVLSNVLRFPDGHPQGEGRFFDSLLKKGFDGVVLPLHHLHADYRKSGVGGCAIHILRRRRGLDASLSKERPKKRRRRSEDGLVASRAEANSDGEDEGGAALQSAKARKKKRKQKTEVSEQIAVSTVGKARKKKRKQTTEVSEQQKTEVSEQTAVSTVGKARKKKRKQKTEVSEQTAVSTVGKDSRCHKVEDWAVGLVPVCTEPPKAKCKPKTKKKKDDVAAVPLEQAPSVDELGRGSRARKRNKRASKVSQR